MTLKKYCLPSLLGLLLTTGFTPLFLSPAYGRDLQDDISADVVLLSQRDTVQYGTGQRETGQSVTDRASTERISERIYIAANGEFLGALTRVSGSLLYIDSEGGWQLSARDYTDEIGHDYRGSVNRIGNADITYDYLGRAEQLGTTAIDYDYRGRVNRIGGAAIAYDVRGKVIQVGDVDVQYDRGVVDIISANYTGSGARIVVVHRSRARR